MSTPAIPLWGICPLMPCFMGGQMFGRAFVRTPNGIISSEFVFNLEDYLMYLGYWFSVTQTLTLKYICRSVTYIP